MKIGSINIDYKEKRSKIEITILHDYFVKSKDKTKSYRANKKSVIIIKKPTKKQIIQEAKKNI